MRSAANIFAHVRRRSQAGEILLFVGVALTAMVGLATAAWADVSIPGDDCPAQLTGDVTIGFCGKLTVSKSIDLNGFNLTLKGVSTVLWGSSATFYSSGEKMGTLWIEHSGDVTQPTAFSGALKFVKDGGGKWTMPKTSDYSGGTEVRGGRLVASTGTSRKLQDSMTPFGTGRRLDILDGTLEGKAYTYWSSYYDLYLDGGTFENTAKADNADTTSFNANVKLESDSTFRSKSVYNIVGQLDLSNHRLTLDLEGGLLRFKPTAVVDGTLSVTGTGPLQLEAPYDMPKVNLELSSSLGLNSQTLGVGNLTLKPSGSVSGEGELRVYGAYRLGSATGYMPKMMGGSTLDLSGLGESVELASANFGLGTVTIALGDRELSANQQIVSWAAKPENVTFAFTGDNIAGRTFSVSNLGIVFDAAADVVSSAAWTGNGEIGNWKDASNWTCLNAAGSAMPGAVPTDEMTVIFSGDVSTLGLNARFPFAGVRFVDAFLSLPTDWSGFDFNRVTDNSLLDTKGYGLTLSAWGSVATTAATITNTAEPEGVVMLTVAEGDVFTNGTLVLTGNLKLVKTGEGTLVASKYPQTYVGVTEVRAGILRCVDGDCLNKNGTDKEAESQSPFGVARMVDVREGAVLDVAGSYDWRFHTVNMRGGVITNSVKATGLATSKGEAVAFSANGGNTKVGRLFNPVLVLDADTTISSDVDFNFQGKVRPNGYQLTLSIAAGHTLLWNTSDVSDLKVVVTGGGTFGVWCKNPVSMPDATLEVENGSLALASHGTYGSGDLVVRNYRSATTRTTNAGGARLTVTGTFTPASDCFYGCTLTNGATIALGAQNGPWRLQSAAAAIDIDTVQFWKGAMVTLALGSRTLEPGERILSWTTRPNDVAFVFAGENVEVDVPAVWRGDGLSYGYAEEPQVLWTNATADGDLTNPANWEGGVVPTTVKATLTGDVSGLRVPTGESFAAEKIWFKEASLAADADFSWLDLNAVTGESILDIKGHKLILAGATDDCTGSGTITDSSNEGGTVVFVVLPGETYTNSNFNLTGSLGFEKQGAGVFVAKKCPQTYAGATTVAAGGLRCAEKTCLSSQDFRSPFGETHTVSVNEGAFLDPAGSYAWGYHTVIMDGGVISNTVEQIGTSGGYADRFNVANFDYPFNPKVILNRDATLYAGGLFNFKGCLVSEGRRLTVVTSADFRWTSSGSTNATVEVTGTGTFRSLKNFPMDDRGLTLVMGVPFDVGGDVTLSNYTAKVSTAISEIRKEDAELNVYGTFKPVADDFFGCTMMSNATICIAHKTGPWSLVRPNADVSKATSYVHFADKAAVTIDIGTRVPGPSRPIVSWTPETKPASDVTFRLNDEAVAAHINLIVAEDGIYAGRKGFVLIIQ